MHVRKTVTSAGPGKGLRRSSQTHSHLGLGFPAELLFCFGFAFTTEEQIPFGKEKAGTSLHRARASLRPCVPARLPHHRTISLTRQHKHRAKLLTTAGQGQSNTELLALLRAALDRCGLPTVKLCLSQDRKTGSIMGE